jgi:site-specific recombinase XerC
MTVADKYSFLATRTGSDARQLPRCSRDVATSYRSKERLIDTAVGAGPATADRRAQVFGLVSARFGKDGGAGLNCERYLLDALYRWLLGAARTEPSLRTYAACLARWCDASDRRSLSAQTDTSPRDVMDFLFALEGRGLSKRSIVLHRDVMRSWFAWLEDRGLLARTPITRDVRKAWRVDHNAVGKGDGTRQAFTAAEAQEVVAYAFRQPPAECFALMLELSGGLRSDEVAALPFVGLVDRDGLVTVAVPGKGQKVRRITLEPVAVAAWRRYERERLAHGPRGGLIRPPAGPFYSARTIQRWAKDAARAVGREEISSHDFRKTAATLRMENGQPIQDVSDELGHSNIVLTARCYVVRKRKHTTGTGLAAPTT